MSFKVEQIDHVEWFVPDRYAAARWYKQALGLRILPEPEHWAGPGGPLMVSSDGGRTMLALFEGEPRGKRATAGYHRVAFRVSGAGFLQFLVHVREVPVYTDSVEPFGHLRPVDHGKAYSVYFCDPYGNRFEVTSYQYQHIKGRRPRLESHHWRIAVRRGPTQRRVNQTISSHDASCRAKSPLNRAKAAGLGGVVLSD